MDEGLHAPLQLALTGATGFIGRELQEQLAAAGYSLRALVRPRPRSGLPFAPGVRAMAVALDDAAGLDAALAGVDVVIHCAGSVRGRDFADFTPANVDGVRALCQSAVRQASPPRIILISSLAATQPALSDYARSKSAGEEELRQMPQLVWTILRPPAVYGPRDREMLPLFRAIRAGVALIVGPPSQRVSLLHVEDLARAVIACLRHPRACHRQTYAIDDGTPGGYDWSDIIAASRGRLPVMRLSVPRGLLMALARVNHRMSGWLRRTPMLTPGKVRELSHDRWLCDNAAFTAATAWTPQIGLQAGVQRLFGGNGNDRIDFGTPG